MGRGQRTGEVELHGRRFWLSKRSNSAAWCITFFEPRTRQTRQTSLGTSDLEAARRELMVKALALTEPRLVAPEAITLGEIVERYWVDHASRLPSAHTAIRLNLSHWARHFGADTLADLTPGRVAAFAIEHLNRGLQASAVNRILSDGRAAINFARKRAWVASIPFIQLLKESAPEPRPLIRPAEFRALLDAAGEREHLRRYLWLAAGTLARPEAILELQWPQIDLAARRIQMNPPGRTQTTKRRPLLPAVPSLAAEIATWPHDAMHVVSYHGRKLREIKSPWRAARDEAGLPRELTPYSIRHAGATAMAVAGVGEIQIARWLGHTTERKTTGRYISSAPEFLAEAAEAVEGFLRAGLAGARNADQPLNHSRAC